MKPPLHIALAAALLLTSTGCSRPEQAERNLIYPPEQADNPERRSGLPMLFYEAAEKDADIHNIVVTPPPEKTSEPPAR